MAIAIISVLFALDQYVESKTARLMSELVSSYSFQKYDVKFDNEATLMDRILFRRRLLATCDRTDSFRGGTITITPYLVSPFETKSGFGTIVIVSGL